MPATRASEFAAVCSVFFDELTVVVVLIYHDFGSMLLLSMLVGVRRATIKAHPAAPHHSRPNRNGGLGGSAGDPRLVSSVSPGLMVARVFDVVK